MSNDPTPTSEVVRDLKADRAEDHRHAYLDGCPDWCEACRERLMCKDGRHEWPRDYSDGDTCYCGAFYLTVNDVDGRPRIIEARHG